MGGDEDRVLTGGVGAVPKPKEGAGTAEEIPLPQTLVRIPVHEMDQIRAKDTGE